MITEIEAQKIVAKYRELKENLSKDYTKYNQLKLKKHEKVCIDKLEYLIRMTTVKYKKFSNYEDLYQEGFISLFHSMSNYDSSKGSFFWWAHKYIKTKIKRCANLHTTIRIPLKEANKNIPHKEFIMPTLIEETYCPDKIAESSEAVKLIKSSMSCLTGNQKIIISMAYGIGMEDSYPINKICKTLGISRVQCNNVIKSAMSKIKTNIMTGKCRNI